MNPGVNFDFYLSNTNKLKPKQLRKLDIVHLIRHNKIDEINEAIQDLSQENFMENDFFDFNKEEQKLIQTYQILTQYLMYSINHLKKKNQLITELSGQQVRYNQEAEEVIAKQKAKIKEQELISADLTNNCLNMEYLIKHLNLEDTIMKLGVKFEGGDSNANFGQNKTTLGEKGFEKLRNEMMRKAEEEDDDDVDVEDERDNI